MPQMPESFKPIDMPESFKPIDSGVEAEAPGLLSRTWSAANEPILDIRSGNTKMATDEFAAEHPILGGGTNFLLDSMSSLTSPLNLGLTALTGGASLAGKLGLAKTAGLLELPAKAAGIGMVGQGGYNLIRPDATLPERAGGLVEAGLGGLGLRSGVKLKVESLEPRVKSIEVPKINVEELATPSNQLDLPLNELKAKPTAISKKLIDPSLISKPEPVQKLMQAVDDIEPIIQTKEQLKSRELARRYAQVSSVETKGEAGFREQKSALSGEMPKVQFEPLKLDSADVDNLYDYINEHPEGYGFRKINAKAGLGKLVQGVVPNRSEMAILQDIFGDEFTSRIKDKIPGGGLLQRIYDLPRGLMSVDAPFTTSAAFRQASSLIGTKAWFKGWVNAAKAYGSKNVATDIENAIRERELFKPAVNSYGKIEPSYADRVGLKLSELNRYSKRDEAIRGELAERIPIYGQHIKGNNRAFNSFMNTAAADTFEIFIKQATSQGLDPMNNIPLGKEIAEAVNTMLKRGKLGVEVGSHQINVEKHARLLSNLFFSPRGIASDVRMLNPSTYATASPFVRRKLISGMARRVGTWWTLAELSQLAGASVSKDPNSADFGKIRIGNTRIDPPGGLQQFLVLGARIKPKNLDIDISDTGHPLIDLPKNLLTRGGGGTTSTTSEEFTPFGEGFKPETRMSTIEKFGINRAHPAAKAVIDLLSATEDQPFRVLDKSIQAVAPMMLDDIMSVANSDPDLAKMLLVGAASSTGMGTQSYERGDYGKPTYVPEEWDINIGAK